MPTSMRSQSQGTVDEAIGRKTRAVERESKASPRRKNEIIKHNAHSGEVPFNGIFSLFA
jgi:hypothetical protein